MNESERLAGRITGGEGKGGENLIMNEVCRQNTVAQVAQEGLL
jgi:hypothetical protein